MILKVKVLQDQHQHQYHQILNQIIMKMMMNMMKNMILQLQQKEKLMVLLNFDQLLMNYYEVKLKLEVVLEVYHLQQLKILQWDIFIQHHYQQTQQHHQVLIILYC